MVLDVWVTKYALTQGIFKCKADVKANETLITVKTASYPTYYHKPYWHLTEKEAQEHARLMKERRIRSLKKQIDKLEKLEF